MRLSSIGKVFTLSLLASVTLSTAFAAKPLNPTAIISFSNAEEAKWSVYAGYRTVFKIDSELSKLATSAIAASDGTLSSADLYYLDLKFQSSKHDLDNVLKSADIWLQAFNGNEINIDINSDTGDHYIFRLPAKLELGINGLSIDGIEGAKQAVTQIHAAMAILNNMLPANADIAQLKNFLSPANDADNAFYITTKENSQALLQSLIRAHDFYTRDLDTCLKLARKVANGTLSSAKQQNLNTKFQALLTEINRITATGIFIGNVKTFANNKLIYTLDGQTHEYNFPALSLSILNLDRDDLLTFDNATSALADVSSSFNFLKEWTISGSNVSFKGVMDRNALTQPIPTAMLVQHKN